MNKLQILEPGPPLARDQISSLEKKMGVILPDDYKEFLLNNNGGVPKPAHFKIPNHDTQYFSGVRKFFAINASIKTSDIYSAIESYKGRMLGFLLPIAYTDIGDVVCLSVSGRTKGKVYFWDHNREHSPPDTENLWALAESFSEFLESLYEHDMEAELRKFFGPE